MNKQSLGDLINLIDQLSKMKYCKHLIECHCILPIFKMQTKPVFHKFPVFSLLDDKEEIIEKWAKCNNCDAVHRVYDYCKSEVVKNSDDYVDMVTTLDDLKFSIPSDVLDVLLKNNKDISDYEQVAFIIKEKLDDKILLTKKEVGDKVVCKYLLFENGKNSIAQETYQIGI